MSLLDIEADVVPSVGEHHMLAARSVRGDHQPGRDPLDAKAFRVFRIGRRSRDPDGSGIEVGMPDDPGRGRSAIRMLSESAAPTREDPDPRIAPPLASQCSPACARLYIRGPGEAIPT